MELQAVTGQLYVVNGTVQNLATIPGLLAQSAPAKAIRSRERDFLFAHLTLTGQPEETVILMQDLLDEIGRQYYQASGSVTAALRKAINEINTLLLRLNLSGTSTIREGAITCAALHNGELFMLQTGESLALLGHNFGVERLPKEDPGRITPLGRSAGIDIRYYHHRLQSGDMLLLADPRIAHIPTQDLAPALTNTEVEFGLGELEKCIGDESARLLLVEFTHHVPADVPDIDYNARASGETLATIPEPTPRRDPEATVAAPQIAPSMRRQQPEMASRPQPSRPTDPGAQPLLQKTIDMEATARKATSEAAMGLSRMTGWLAQLLTRLRPVREGEDQSDSMAVPTLLAIIIPLIVAVIVSSVYLQRGRVRRFADIKVEMGQNLAQAEEFADVDELARGHYQTVLALALEAETLRPGDGEIDRLRQQALVALDNLENVTRLNTRLLYEYEQNVFLADVVLREGFNGGVFTLDSTGNAVYLHETDESYLNDYTATPSLILSGGQAAGNHVVGTVLDLMWRPLGNAVSRDGLAMLDRAGTLFTYYPNFGDIRAVPLGLASEWRLPTVITSFDERLYILDTGANEIWKYFPDGDGFVLKDNERSIVFDEDAELDRAVDISIYSEDGSLIVLYGDGRLRYYDTRSGRVQWDETDLLQNGLNSPFIAPTAIKLVGRGLNASIYVADPGSGRIIQISRGGTVLAQWRAIDDKGQELFARITDFAVADTPLRIFVTAGNALYVAIQE